MTIEMTLFSPPFSYAIRRDGERLNRDGKWEWEMSPSNRDAAFLLRCRFDTFDEARQAAERAIGK